MKKPVCLITGVGPGTGSALVRRFALGGYAVAMLARNPDRLQALAAEVDDAHAFACDVGDTQALIETYDAVENSLGAPAILVHNAVAAERGSYMDIDPAGLRRAFEINTMALLELARLATPAMIEQGTGAIICTGNTSAYRGRPAYAGFAPSKSCAADPLGEHRARRWTQRHPRGVCRDRCRHRSAMDPAPVRGQTG